MRGATILFVAATVLFFLQASAFAQFGVTAAKKILADAGAIVGVDMSDLTIPLSDRPVIFVRAFGNMEDNELIQAALFRKLDHLVVKSPRITDEGVAGICGLPRLRYVALDSPKIGDPSIKHLARLPSLEHLSLMRTGVTDAGMKDIVAMPKLKQLDLNDTALTDVGLMTLVGAKKLEMLVVDRTKVTEAGLKAFREARPECKLGQ